MADTTTTNYNWVIPELGGSPNTWDEKLKDTIEAIDTIMFGKANLAGFSMSINGQGAFDDGTLAAPGITFVGDENTGFSQSHNGVPTAGHITVSINASEVADFDATGFTTNTLSLKTALDLYVTTVKHGRLLPVQIDADNGGFDVYSWLGGTMTFLARFVAGKIGLGTQTPQSAVDINGQIVNNLTDLGAGIGAVAIDVRLGNHFKKTITGNTTFSFTNTPIARVSWFSMKLTNGGAFTTSWPASVKWQSSVPPALTISGKDTLGFITYDDGATWTGTMSVKAEG